MLRGREIALGLVVASAFWAIMFLWQSQHSAHQQHNWYNTFFEHTPEWLVAIFTATLWWSTRKLWKAGEKQIAVAKQAADAAMLSARAAVALQLPIIRVKPDTLGNGQSSVGGTLTEYCDVHSLTFSNLGPTKAFPVEIRCGWTVAEKLPVEPTYLVTEAFLPNYIFEPDPKVTPRKTLQFQIPLKPGEWSLICGGKLPVWFYCSFGYDDFMGTRHDVDFCWRWQNIGHGMDWRVDATPAYNRKT